MHRSNRKHHGLSGQRKNDQVIVLPLLATDKRLYSQNPLNGHDCHVIKASATAEKMKIIGLTKRLTNGIVFFSPFLHLNLCPMHLHIAINLG